MDYVKKAYLKLKTINNDETCSIETSDGSTTEDELEKILKSRDRCTTSGNNTNFLSIVAKYEEEPRLKHTENILKYWNGKSIDLAIVAKSLLSLPVTQVSVERAFSGFTFIFNNYRTNLKPETLEKLLFLRFNYDNQ